MHAGPARVRALLENMGANDILRLWDAGFRFIDYKENPMSMAQACASPISIRTVIVPLGATVRRVCEGGWVHGSVTTSFFDPSQAYIAGCVWSG